MIAIISDTHMPKGKRQLPQECVKKLRAAEAVIHAGDFSAVSVLGELEAFCPVVLGVYGNVDEPALWQRLPETREVEVGGQTVAVVHDAGLKQGPQPPSPARAGRRLSDLQSRQPDRAPPRPPSLDGPPPRRAERPALRARLALTNCIDFYFCRA